ncbi:MAG TPA: response regulator [Desulfobacterales bacterium]|nr:response regulator [Desulfobacterales bacterium]
MNEKILIIDRESDIRKTLEALLRKEGYQVRSASRGKEAIDSFKSEPSDLVIMDIRIPGIDGLELMKQIKNLDPDLEIIVLTGAVSIENIIKVLRDERAFDFLPKPLQNWNKLIFTVRGALKKRRLNKKRKVSEKEIGKSYIKMESRIRELADELHKITRNRFSEK